MIDFPRFDEIAFRMELIQKDISKDEVGPRSHQPNHLLRTDF